MKKRQFSKAEMKIPKILKILLILIIIALVLLILSPMLEILAFIWISIQAFVFAFGLAFLSYPIVTLFEKFKIPTLVSKILVILLIVGVIILLGFQILPLLTEQLPILISNAQKGITKILEEYKIGSELTDVISNQSNLIAKSAGGIFNTVLGLLGTVLLTLFIFLYIIFDYEKICDSLRKFSKGKRRMHPFLHDVNYELSNYIKSLWIIIAIQIIEYSFFFGLIARHPSWLLLAILSGLSVFVPYIGGILVNILAILTAYTVSIANGEMSVLILTIIISLILPNIDSYVISPIVYKRTVKINPILMLFATVLLFSFFGIIGLFFVAPILIIITLIKKYYGKSIVASLKNII